MVYCIVCNSKFRKKIEEEITTGGPAHSIASISKRYNIKSSQLNVHKREHMHDAVDEARIILDRECKEAGVNRVLNDIEVLNLIIKQAPSLMDKITPQDVIRAIKLKGELLGDIKERTETNVKMEWLETLELEE